MKLFGCPITREQPFLVGGVRVFDLNGAFMILWLLGRIISLETARNFKLAFFRFHPLVAEQKLRSSSQVRAVT
jgi:hypothetical protein